MWPGVLLCVDRLGMAVGAAVRTKRYAGAVAIVKPDKIGDFVLWLGAGAKLRRYYRGRPVVLMANAEWADLAGEVGIWDEVWAVNRDRLERNLFYRLNVMRRLSGAGFAIAVNAVHSRSFGVDDALTRATRAAVRVGSSGDALNTSGWWKRISDGWYATLIPVSSGAQHELIWHAEFLRGLGVEDVHPQVTDLREFAAGKANPLADGRGYVVFVPGAGGAKRQWPVSAFADVADRLSETHGLTGVLCGSKPEYRLAEAVRDAANGNLKNMAGQTDLGTLLAVIRDARLVVSNDTSAVHMAAALGTPCVCIVGGGHFGRFLPYRREWKSPGPLPVAARREMDCFGCNWKCIYSVGEGEPVPCIGTVPPERVADLADKVLSGKAVSLDQVV